MPKILYHNASAKSTAQKTFFDKRNKKGTTPRGGSVC